MTTVYDVPADLLISTIAKVKEGRIVTPEGKYVHGAFINRIFWQINGVREFQVIQDTINNINFRIVIDDYFDTSQLKQIEEILLDKSPNWSIEFKLVDTIDRTESGKYRAIINKIYKDDAR